MFLIGGIQKTTLIDYPQKVASIVFTQGCNFRCGYCHNPELIDKCNIDDSLSVDDYINFLKTRQGKLDGVVITGGEPTLQSGLMDFIKKIKNLGFCVKLDTNGTRPDVIENLINNKMLDYIAMDIKAPIEKYSDVTGVNVNTENIKKSIDLIMKSSIDYEFRTTVVKSLLSIDDILRIGEQIKGAKKYYLQKFVVSKIFDKNLIKESTYTDKEFLDICTQLKNYVKLVDYR